MYPRPAEVQHLAAYRLRITFADATEVELDFEPMVRRGGRFRELQDVEKFGTVRVDEEAETLVWPDNIDLCPDVLYHQATGAPLPGDLPTLPARLVRNGVTQ